MAYRSDWHANARLGLLHWLGERCVCLACQEARPPAESPCTLGNVSFEIL